VGVRLDALELSGGVEARPARAGVELRLRAEELRAASRAAVDTRILRVDVHTGERALGPRLTEYAVLLRRQALTPLLVGQLSARHASSVSRRSLLAGTDRAHRPLTAISKSELVPWSGLLQQPTRASERWRQRDRARASAWPERHRAVRGRACA